MKEMSNTLALSEYRQCNILGQTEHSCQTSLFGIGIRVDSQQWQLDERESRLTPDIFIYDSALTLVLSRLMWGESISIKKDTGMGSRYIDGKKVVCVPHLNFLEQRGF